MTEELTEDEKEFEKELVGHIKSLNDWAQERGLNVQQTMIIFELWTGHYVQTYGDEVVPEELKELRE